MESRFPPTSQNDAEDVAWALSTGAALFKRGEHKDALVWLKRAADAASEAGDAARARELDDAAANLVAGLPTGGVAAGPAPPKVSKPPPLPPVLRKPPPLPPRLPDAGPGEASAPASERANEPTDRRIQPPSPQTAPGDESAAESAALSLRQLRPLAELSEAVQSGLLQTAIVESLGPDEEAKLVGLALVIKGEVSVAATIMDIPAAKMAAGDVIYAKGSVADSVSLRLVAREPGAVVALWDNRVSDEALSTSPALLERLRRASTRIQALAGTTMGPIGDRLDDKLRAVATERLELRVLAPGEVVAEAGQPVAGMVVLGVGSIELEIDGEVQEKLGPGDVLFGSEVLEGGNAPATAVAGAKGAAILFGERQLVRELALSFPPLLEIFSEM